MNADEYVVVWVTAGGAEEAERLARAVVEERLAACCSRVAPIRSIYRWKGSICEEDEHLLMIKTRRDLLDRLTHRIREIHSYNVPEIIALPLVGGSEAYLRWIDENVS